MEHHIDDIDGIKDIFTEAYYCIRSLNVNDEVINK